MTSNTPINKAAFWGGGAMAILIGSLSGDATNPGSLTPAQLRDGLRELGVGIVSQASGAPGPDDPDDDYEFNRLNDTDAGVGRTRPEEARAAVEFQRRTGLRLDRAPEGRKWADFVIRNEQGITDVNFMYVTPLNTKAINGLNANFGSNFVRSGIPKIQSHLANNGLVVMDFRALTTPNQQIVANYLRTLSRNSLSKIRIMD